ncbi:DUF6765 family protein [Desulfoluna spongiiphila]|uniref:Uncharacterized protein n=1 Tax=Desulfoluna spongiiphila TaxID=419481 RepID=A0A1G5DJK0_9BACT|nr:DUF6765 family protein [Desulfoluna spongiiphila]SCY14826.1 hypothetical protein SAMN05216233_104226 [Desulfoluna spongiiphila]
MNIDFHYYATYTAARIAGYSFTEAQTIAHAAQYVDESDHALLQDEAGQPHIGDFDMVPTVQTNAEMVKYNTIAWSGTHLDETLSVWIPFHFLPGNYGHGHTVDYTGPMEDHGWTNHWVFNRESEQKFKLICLPNSLLLGEMINNVVEAHADNLQMLGLRMHILCDTWAHCYYAGIPAWFMNNAGETVMDIHPDGSEHEVAWTRVWPLGDLFNPEIATPALPAYNSYAYQGHGRMGHLPDYPYMRYRYQPQWSGEPIIKDNRDFFMKAFKQMVQAMTCVRNRAPFTVETYAPLDSATEQVIREILDTREPDQCGAWRKNIGRILVDGQALEVPETFERMQWLNEYLASSDKAGTSYYRFNRAAVDHLGLVHGHLESQGLFFLSGDEGPNTVSMRLRNRDGACIGKMSESAYGIGSSQYYPRMSNIGLTHKVIKPDGGPLRSGAVTEIKTTEGAVGEYAFLGAWETPALYYYTKDYSVNKQRWIIEKSDLSQDDVIRPGDRVYVKNQNFTDKPYLAAYQYGDGYQYLTTIATQVEWDLEEGPMPGGVPVQYRTSDVTLQGGNGQFIGAMQEESLFPSTQYFPKMRTAAITVSLIHADNEDSRDVALHGASIKIKTNESATGNYCFLGAWSTPSLYYYTKDYDTSKQGWTLEKINLEDGEEIRAGDRVRIKNHHYTDKPYLAWHRSAGDNYLTTIADGNSDEAIWVVGVKMG